MAKHQPLVAKWKRPRWMNEHPQDDLYYELGWNQWEGWKD